MRLKKLFFSFSLLMLAAFSFAQVSIIATVDKPSVNLAEDINLTILVKAPTTSIESPQMPSLPNFNIYSSGQSRSVQINGSKINVEQKFTYILTPRFAGKSTIGAFSIKVDGKEYTTDPIEVEVYRKDNTKQTQATVTNPQKGEVANTGKKSNSKVPDFFMTATTDKSSAYLNEQVILKIRFYQAQSTLGNPQYNRPKMEGLVPEEIKTNQESKIIDGKQYIYTEFVTALFGILPGNAVVGPATVQYNIVEGAGLDTFDLFFNAANGAQLKEVKSDPVALRIKPLPKENRPRTFYGAVGTDYSISASVDNTKPQAGEPITLSVTVKGNGNMRAIADIPAPDMGSNFRVYDTTSSSSTKINGTLVGGVKTYKTVIVPRVSGAFEIPPTYFSYFDTSSGSYKTLRAPSILLDISPAAARHGNTTVSFSSDTLPSAPRVEKLNNDISYIKDGKTSYFSMFLLMFAHLGKVNYLLFVILAGAALFNILNRKQISLLSRRKAYKEAKKELGEARTLGEVSLILTRYLEAKKGGPIGIMTISDVAAELKITPLNSQALAKLWGEFEMLKYAPAAMLTNSIAVSEAAEKTLNLIKELEKEIK